RALRRTLLSATASPGDITASARGHDVEAAKLEAPRVHFEQPTPANDDAGPGPYLERYQGRTGRLSRHASPDAKRAPTITTSSAKEPELSVWALSTRVSAGRPGSVRALLRDASGKPLAPEQIEITRVGPNGAPLGPPTAMLALSAGPGADAAYGY